MKCNARVVDANAPHVIVTPVAVSQFLAVLVTIVRRNTVSVAEKEVGRTAMLKHVTDVRRTTAKTAGTWNVKKIGEKHVTIVLNRFNQS